MTARRHSAARDEWVNRARAVKTETVLRQRDIMKTLTGRNDKFVGACPVCRSGTDRFAVNLKKGNGGAFNCRICRVGGNTAISLVMWLDQCDFLRAVETLAGPAPDDDKDAKTETDEQRAEREQRERRRRERAEGEEREQARRETEYNEQQLRKARYLWSRRQPVVGSIAERYLREARGYHGPLPATLGFLPSRSNYPPAMIGAFGFADEPEPGVLAIKPDDVRAVHITRLAPDGSDKAGTTEDKITLAPHKGFPIVLAAPNDLLALAITEGIEDALSFAIATGTGVWAAGSAGHLPDLATVIPNYIEVVHVVIDDDESGRTNGTELVRQIKARGIEVYPIYLKKRRVAA